MHGEDRFLSHLISTRTTSTNFSPAQSTSYSLSVQQITWEGNLRGCLLMVAFEMTMQNVSAINEDPDINPDGIKSKNEEVRKSQPTGI